LEEVKLRHQVDGLGLEIGESGYRQDINILTTSEERICKSSTQHPGTAQLGVYHLTPHHFGESVSFKVPGQVARVFWIVPRGSKKC
jgi:hypothetical protein